MRRLSGSVVLILWLIAPVVPQLGATQQETALAGRGSSRTVSGSASQHPDKASSQNPPAPTWEPPPTQPSGSLSSARLHSLPNSAFAFARIRKEPLTDAAHVRSALARFRRVQGVTDPERDLAFANIKTAAAYFGVHLRVSDWRELGLKP